MVIVTGSSSVLTSSAASTFSISMVLPSCMLGMMTMKMMSNTNTTSTSGVTLMTGVIDPPFFPLFRLNATGGLQVVDELAGCMLHAQVELLEPCREVVEEQ